MTGLKCCVKDVTIMSKKKKALSNYVSCISKLFFIICNCLCSISLFALGKDGTIDHHLLLVKKSAIAYVSSSPV